MTRRTRYTLGPKRTMSFSVPPKQAIKAGWHLLTMGIWYWLTRRDVWLSADFREK